LKRISAALVALVSTAAIAVAGAWLARRSLQQDFAAYWIAGNARRLGLDPYLNQVGSAAAPALWDGVAVFHHSRFLYPPLIADLFRPLAALPYRLAKTLFTGATIAAWLGAGLLQRGRRDRLWFFGASALFFPLYRHLERGQVDLLLLLLLVVAWRSRARPLVAGTALALGAAFKPALFGLLPVVWASGRGRAALAALGATAAIVVLTLAVCRPARLHEYLVSVLPRAALYGEGGTEEMLLPADRFPSGEGSGASDEGTTTLDGRSYRTSVWDAPAAASVPRLLAPDSPTRATSLGAYLLAILGLAWAAGRLRRRSADEHDHDSDGDAEAEAMLMCATAIACVVMSPAGWVMGLVVAIPIAPCAAARLAAGHLSLRAALALGAAWIALALPAPFVGFPALAGSALVAVATTAALASPGRPLPRGAA
jgi:Glycosyltransferase family 87